MDFSNRKKNQGQPDKMRKKLLIVSFDLELGGVERSLIGLLSALDYSRYDVDMFLYAHTGELMSSIPPEVTLLPELPAYSLIKKPLATACLKNPMVGMARCISKAVGWVKQKFFDINGDMLVQNCRFCLPFWPPIKTRYDLALSFASPHYLVANRVSADKKIGWIHSDYQQCGVDRKLEVSMWKHLDYVIAVSEYVKTSFAQVFPEVRDRLFVIENILSPKYIRQLASEIDEPGDVQVNAGETRICSVGRFCNAKNFDSIPNIVLRLTELGARVRWFLIGFGGDEELIRSKIKYAGVEDSVLILGKKANPYPYIKACDIYVQPSRYEGKAVAVREAQILGKPVLITNFPTAQSQLEDGVDGVICPLSIDGLVEGVRKLINDKGLCEKLVTTCAERDYSNRDEVEKIYQMID